MIWKLADRLLGAVAFVVVMPIIGAGFVLALVAAKVERHNDKPE